jgi:hypothetical protein
VVKAHAADDRLVKQVTFSQMDVLQRSPEGGPPNGLLRGENVAGARTSMPDSSLSSVVARPSLKAERNLPGSAGTRTADGTTPSAVTAGILRLGQSSSAEPTPSSTGAGTPSSSPTALPSHSGASSPQPTVTLASHNNAGTRRTARGTLYGVHKTGGLMNIRWYLVATLLHGLRTNRTVLLPPTVSSRSAFVKEWSGTAAGWRQVPLQSIFDTASLETCLANRLGMRVLNASVQPPLPHCQRLLAGGPSTRCANEVRTLATVEPGDDDVVVPLAIEMLRMNDEEARTAAVIDACLHFAPAVYRGADSIVARMAAAIAKDDSSAAAPSAATSPTSGTAKAAVPSQSSLPPLVVGLHVRAEADSWGFWDLRSASGHAVRDPPMNHTEYAARVIERLAACVSSWRNATGAGNDSSAASRPVRVVYVATGLPLNSTLLHPLRAAYPGARVLSKETIGDNKELALLSEHGSDAVTAVDAAVLAHPFIAFMSGAAFSTFGQQVAIERIRAGLPARLHGYVREPAVCPALTLPSSGRYLR